MSDLIKPFTIAVPDEVLEDLHHRLDHTRFPDQIPDTGWSYGADMAYIEALCSYWRASYDWRRHEKKLNGFSQFQTEIDGQNIHFIHVRSKQETATPLLIIHGWPGSVSEFMRIIEPLTDPQAHGGSPGDAFHVVCYIQVLYVRCIFIKAQVLIMKEGGIKTGHDCQHYNKQNKKNDISWGNYAAEAEGFAGYLIVERNGKLEKQKPQTGGYNRK